MSLERTEYYRSNLLSVRYVACRAADKELSDVESADGDTLILPLRGMFTEHFSHRMQVLAEPNIALILPAGCPSRVSHPVATEDDCLVAEYSRECFEGVLASLRSGKVPLTWSHALLSPAAMAARNLVWLRLRRRLCGPLEAEESALALLFHALRSSREARSPGRRNSGILRRIEAARVVLLSHPERNWSLASLARALDCSPFHLTRMFRRYVGIPLHRYLMNIRLARSIDMLLDTDRDLTAIALDLGFSSHSHFTVSFRQGTGFTPGRIRQVASSFVAAEVRKRLALPAGA